MSARRPAFATLVGVISMVALVAGCSVGASGPPASQRVAPYPAGCPDFGFSERRCTAIVALARHQLGIDDPAAAIELLSEPPPDCGVDSSGRKNLCMRSGHISVIVRMTPPGGAARDATFFCGVGGQYSIACTPTPEIRLATPMDGYHDIPCGGEDANGNPSGCATPVPPLEPAAAADAGSLSVAVLDIAIDHDGAYAIEVGRAGIPNGVLTEARFSLAGPTLDALTLEDGVIALVVEPVDPAGRPFRNIYEHGWTKGVEATTVVLRFVVVEHQPGAVIPIRDLAVR